MNELLKSKKFWISVIGLSVPVLNGAFGWGLVVEEVYAAMTPMIVYVLGQGMADFGKEAKKQDITFPVATSGLAYTPGFGPTTAVAVGRNA